MKADRYASCSFLGLDGTRCNRTPISADYIDESAIEGDQLIASLCRRHDGGHAKAEAARRGITRVERGLSVVDGPQGPTGLHTA